MPLTRNQRFRRRLLDPTLTLFYNFKSDKSLLSGRGGVYGPILDITRATIATFVGDNGLIQTVLAGQARFDHSPSTKESLGLLVEEVRTNLCLQNVDLVSAPWTSIQTPGLATNNAISPRGLLEVTLFTDNNATNREGVNQSITVPNNSATHTSSVFVKKTTGATSPTFGLEMNYSGGTQTAPIEVRLNTDTGETNGEGGGGTQAQDFGDYWRLWGQSTNNSTGNTILQVKVFPALAANGSFVDVASTQGSAHAWGAQTELGTFPSSYIETTTVAVTRNADVVDTTDVSWLTAGVGTMFAEYTHLGITSSANHVWTLHDNSTTRRINHHLSGVGGGLSTSNFFAANGANIVSLGDALALPADTISRSALTWTTNDWRAQTDGRTAVVDTSGTPPVISELAIGYQGVTNIQFLNGHIREIRYYNVRKDNTFLEDLSNGKIQT